jgi:CspA family cold shock protein
LGKPFAQISWSINPDKNTVCAKIIRGADMTSGIVKWFSNAKGYGFILSDDGQDDIFAHFSSIEMEGYKTLKEGQRVEFEVATGPKGLQASNIRAAVTGDIAPAETSNATADEPSIEFATADEETVPA